MKKKDILKRAARLESINDQLLTEICSLDSMMKKLGFKDGIKTLKITALELLNEQMQPPFAG